MDKTTRYSLIVCTAALLLVPLAALHAADFHVAPSGNDANPGTRAAPLRTIQRAADLAQPGDVITVHEGVYRERIKPRRGGESDQKRIVYQAAPGEKVEIKGSEVAKSWVKVQDDVWKVTLPNSFFGGFNPYSDLIHGDWFSPKGRQHHTGAVYLNGHWLTEAAKQEDALKPVGDNPLWFGQADETSTTIWAQFKGVDPNKEDVEINVRQTVFYPEKPGVNFITVRGFTMEHAATPWAPPTAEQIGLIGTHWSKGWIIENNNVRYSVCTGITLGKHGDEFDNTSQNSAEGYVKTIERALENGWSRQNIGHHIVRNNHISHCEQAGIVGSMGPVFCTVTGNTIHDIHVRRLFGGAEMAGIKFHGAVDTVISRNHIYRTCRGIWLDWMTQGTRVTGNLLHDNGPSEDLFVEVNHGPFLVDNNLLLSRTSIFDMSEGGAYVHNLLGGSIRSRPEMGRSTPFLKPHSTEVAGLSKTPGGDSRYYNNILIGHNGLSAYDGAKLPVFMAGNVFLSGAKPSKHEPSPLVQANVNPGLKLVEKPDGIYLQITLDRAWAQQQREVVTTELLGKAKIPDLPYEQPDGSPYRIDTDYLGRKRSDVSPFPGPFELSKRNKQELKVWPVATSRGATGSADAATR